MKPLFIQRNIIQIDEALAQKAPQNCPIIMILIGFFFFNCVSLSFYEEGNICLATLNIMD